MKERRHQSRAIPGTQGDFVDRIGRLLPQVGDLDRLSLRKRSADVRLVKADVAVRQRVDQLLIHAVGGAQMKFALHVVEDVDRAGFGAGELHRLGDDGREHSLRSSVEFTAWETSPRARNSPTERPSSSVRWRSSLSRRVFSMAMTACAAKLVTSAICLSVKGRTSCR